MTNAEYHSWLWKWFKGWAIATVFIIITTTHCHAFGMPFFSGSSWMNEGAASYASPTQGVVNPNAGFGGNIFRIFMY